MTDYTKYNRGSEWRKWDLHIHTPETKKNDQFTGSTPIEKWENYITAINNSTEEIAVIGITDYFTEESKSHKDIVVEEPQAYYFNSTGFNYQRFFKADSKNKLSIILQAEEHILGLQDGKNRFVKEVTLLSKAFALSVPHESAMQIKDEVAFFQAVKARLVKFEGATGGTSDVDIETTIKQIIDEALSSDKVIDIFDAAGLKKPDISILSEEFLLEIKGMKHQNLALELLKKLLNDEIKARTKFNLLKP